MFKPKNKKEAPKWPKKRKQKAKVMVAKRREEKPSFVKEEEKPKQTEKAIQTVYDGPKCECGEPVAPGQNYVCRKHIRST
jgi:hypothetical protein